MFGVLFQACSSPKVVVRLKTFDNDLIIIQANQNTADNYRVNDTIIIKRFGSDWELQNDVFRYGDSTQKRAIIQEKIVPPKIIPYKR